MKLTSLDLELNQPSGKIIQIGAVVGDTETGEITQRLRIYVNPGEPIAPFITELCAIANSKSGFTTNIEFTYKPEPTEINGANFEKLNE